MPTVAEQFSAATKAHFEAQLALINTLTSKAFEGVGQAIELNVDAVKSSFESATDAARKLGSAGTPQDFIAAAKQAQPDPEQAREYARRMGEIAAGMQAEFTRAAETQVAETRKKLAALVDEAAKNAPKGSEQAIATMKTLLQNADAAYEQLAQNARQAALTMQASMKSVGEQAGAHMAKAAATVSGTTAGKTSKK